MLEVVEVPDGTISINQVNTSDILGWINRDGSMFGIIQAIDSKVILLNLEEYDMSKSIEFYTYTLEEMIRHVLKHKGKVFYFTNMLEFYKWLVENEESNR